MSDIPTWVYYVGIGTLAFAVGTAVVTGAFRLGKWVQRINDTGEKTAKLPEIMNEILAKLDRIFDRLPPPQSVSAGSPLRLTELGESIAEALGASEWAKEAAAAGWVLVHGKSPYDVQAACERYIHQDYGPSNEMEERIKESAYENGIDRKQVLDVLVIALRDQLLEDA